MSDGQVVLSALGSSGKPLEIQPRLVYPTNAKMVTLEIGTLDLYKSMVDLGRNRAFEPLAVGELKVFFKEQRPDFTPHQAINRLEKLGLLLHVSGTKASRSDPPFRAIVLRPVCEFRNEANRFVPDECPQATSLAEVIAETLESSPVVVKASRVVTKAELEQEFAVVVARYDELDEQWADRREELEQTIRATNEETHTLCAEVVKLQTRIAELQARRTAEDAELDAHNLSKPAELDTLRHNREALQQAIDVYDVVAPLYFRS